MRSFMFTIEKIIKKEKIMYGVWNDMKKEFQFGIKEPTPKKSRTKTIQEDWI